VKAGARAREKACFARSAAAVHKRRQQERRCESIWPFTQRRMVNVTTATTAAMNAHSSHGNYVRRCPDPTRYARSCDHHNARTHSSPVHTVRNGIAICRYEAKPRRQNAHGRKKHSQHEHQKKQYMKWEQTSELQWNGGSK